MLEQNRQRLALKDNPTAQGLILTTLLLLAVGAVAVPSALATLESTGSWQSLASIRHLLFATVAAGVVFIAWRFDYRRLGRGRLIPATAALATALIFGLLVFVPGIGRSVGGYYRWIRIGPASYGIGFQPSELIKLTMVIFMSAWLCRDGAGVRSFRKSFLPVVLAAGLCIGVVITQDLGTAILIALAAGATMLLAGVQWYYLAGLAASGAGGGWIVLIASPRKLQRITAMLDPTAADNPCTYQLRQSLTAVASGGWLGKGLGRGMMKRGFLPEDSTDFLFAAICEEWGFVAAAILTILLIAWLVLAHRAAMRADNRFGQVLAGSLGFMICLQAAMHIAVNLGCLPPTGIAMPLVSAGGTSLVLTAVATALIISVSSRPAAGIKTGRLL